MIKISRLRNTISITGHAEHDVEGKDIVCAGVSASAQLLADILEGLTATDVEVRKGHLYIKYARDIHTDIIVAKFMKQMVMMEMQYPKNIEVEEREHADNSSN